MNSDPSLALDGLLKNINPMRESNVSELTPQFQYGFRYNNNSRLWKTKVGGSGSVTNSNHDAIVQSTATSTDYGILTSVIPSHYRNGQQSVLRMTAASITSPNPTSTKLSFNLWGFMDRCDAPSATTLPRNFIGFGYNQFDGFFIGIKNDDNVVSTFSTLFVTEANWNGEKLGFTLDQTKFNIFEIRMIFLGYLGVEFYIYDNTVNGTVMVHKYNHNNSFTSTYTDNPLLSIGLLSQNDATSNTAGEVRCHSVLIGVLGKDNNHFPPRAIEINSGGISSGTHFLVLLCKDQYASLDNFARIFVQSINLTASNSGSNQSNIRLYKGNTFSVAPTYTDVDTSTSIASIATGVNVGTISSLGSLVYSISLGNNGNISIEDLRDIYVEPNCEISFRVDTNGGNSTVDMSLLIKEDL